MLVGRKASNMITATIRWTTLIGISLTCPCHSLMEAMASRIKVIVGLNGYEEGVVAPGQQPIRSRPWDTPLSSMETMPVSPLAAVARLGLQRDVRNIESVGKHARHSRPDHIGIARRHEMR